MKIDNSSTERVEEFKFRLDCLEYMDDNNYAQWQLAQNSISAGPFEP